MRVRMGSQGPLTPCPAPSGRRLPPCDQKEGVGAARPADRPSFSGLVGGLAAVGDSSSSSTAGPRARPAWRRAHQGGVERGSARPGMGRVGMRSLWEGVVAVAELRGAPRLPAAAAAAGGAASPLRAPLWPLLGSLAADTGPRGRFRAGCGRLGAPGVRARPPCAFHRLPRPSANRGEPRSSDDRRSKKRLKKGGKEAKRQCRLKRS